MKTNECNSEIAELEKNRINLKIKNVEGYIVKKSSLSSNLEWYYERRSKSKECKKSGLNYAYFINVPENACFIFTECPLYCEDNQLDMELEEGCIIVTIYESPEDFMASSLAEFYRQIYNENAVYSWDEFGYYRTKSKHYNIIPIVVAISKLRPNKQIRREPPKERKGICDNLFV
ncbi:hypothetical protein E0I26_04125 [Flavobacterium rhamnosiphilum]|uniref:Uncharacterized protein n=1 Tax=Flavobacterium rhamnosiphilum TaxID=2541724 RepID=A0A4R5FAS5_9FLAO|nr:hypothetical protein [Flavobacterium rhamnosiphilum]TDE45882.1 hypothetical protein E0I26_04125 [Flavobacterium rhamnosiphilum]